MNIKLYNFRYQNSTSKVITGMLDFIANLAYPIILCWGAMFIMAVCGVLHYLTLELCLVFLGISFVIGLLFALRFTFSYKGVILYEDYMEIITNNIVGRKPKIVIRYQEIISAYNSAYDIKFDKRKARKAFLVGDHSYYVELTLNGGKQFCFSVENQQEFVDELIQRVNEVKKNT